MTQKEARLTEAQIAEADKIIEALEIEDREFYDYEGDKIPASRIETHRDNQRRIVLGLSNWTDIMFHGSPAPSEAPKGEELPGDATEQRAPAAEEE